MWSRYGKSWPKNILGGCWRGGAALKAVGRALSDQRHLGKTIPPEGL